MNLRNVVSTIFAFALLLPTAGFSEFGFEDPVFQHGGELAYLKEDYQKIINRRAKLFEEMHDTLLAPDAVYGINDFTKSTIFSYLLSCIIIKEKRFQSVAAARLYFFKVLKDILAEVDSYPRFRPILKEYPFNPNDVDLLIVLGDDKKLVKEPYISKIVWNAGTIKYKQIGTNGKEICIYSETYEEAMGKLYK